TARTRRLSPSDGGRPSLPKMLATCFSTAPPEMNKAALMPPLHRPSAIRPRTSRSRRVSVFSPSVRRLARNSWLTTSGSRAVPPSATRSSAAPQPAPPLLEQVADPGGVAGQQPGGVAGLHVLGEHQHAGVPVLLAQLQGGAQA